MKINKTKVVNGRAKLTKDIEADEEILGKECVRKLKNFRKKNGDGVDLSIYDIQVQESAVE